MLSFLSTPKIQKYLEIYLCAAQPSCKLSLYKKVIKVKHLKYQFKVISNENCFSILKTLLNIKRYFSDF